MMPIDSIDRYGELALRTLAPAIKENLFLSCMNAATGLASESGEIEELLRLDDRDRDPVHVQKELGDWSWYWSLMNFAYSRNNSIVLDGDSINDFMERNEDSMAQAAEGITFGLGVVTGKINEFVKKHHFHFHPWDDEHQARLADNMREAFLEWCVATVALGFRPQAVLALNIEKLMARYPEGFSTERSLHRAADDV